MKSVLIGVSLFVLAMPTFARGGHGGGHHGGGGHHASSHSSGHVTSSRSRSPRVTAARVSHTTHVHYHAAKAVSLGSQSTDRKARDPIGRSAADFQPPQQQAAVQRPVANAGQLSEAERAELERLRQLQLRQQKSVDLMSAQVPVKK